MGRTRYGGSRTLVRRLRRLPDESRKEFRAKVSCLRKQFEEFNRDASEICQWLMSLRPGGKKGCDATKEFWHFVLEPERFLADKDGDEADKYRRLAFDAAAGIDGGTKIVDVGLSGSLVESIGAVGNLALTPTAARLFERLCALDRSHREVLIKAAAEWILAHYLRGYQNWECQHEQWEREKAEWEKEHPELTESIRQQFNEIFKRIAGKMGAVSSLFIIRRVSGGARLNCRLCLCCVVMEGTGMGRSIAECGVRNGRKCQV